MSVALTPWPTGPAELARATAAVASALGMRRDDADPQVPFLVKLPDDTRHLSVDVGPSMGAEHTIRAVTSIEEIGTSDLTISEITHTGAVIAFLCAGGIEGQEYQLLIRWQTEPDIPVGEPGQTLSAALRLAVRVRWSDADDRATQDPDLRRAAATASALVEHYAPAAPQQVRDEAMLRCTGYLMQQPSAAIRRTQVGPIESEFMPSRQSALRHSGAMALLSPFRRRRAGLA